MNFMNEQGRFTEKVLFRIRKIMELPTGAGRVRLPLGDSVSRVYAVRAVFFYRFS